MAKPYVRWAADSICRLLAQHYLESEHEAGNADVPDTASAANQFLGMIANYVLWPRMLLTDWKPAASDIHNAVEEAVRTMLARYTPDPPA